jgi:hypothetical protein
MFILISEKHGPTIGAILPLLLADPELLTVNDFGGEIFIFILAMEA